MIVAWGSVLVAYPGSREWLYEIVHAVITPSLAHLDAIDDRLKSEKLSPKRRL